MFSSSGKGWLLENPNEKWRDLKSLHSEPLRLFCRNYCHNCCRNLRFAMKDYLVYRTIKSEKYRFFSCCIPKDLQSYFNNRSKFYLSFKFTNKQACLISQNLNRVTTELFAITRDGMKSLKRRDSKTNLVGASCHERIFL